MRLTLGLMLVLFAAIAGAADAAVYQPSAGKMYAGVGPGDPTYYDNQTQSSPAVLDDYITWYGTFDWYLKRANTYGARPIISLMPNQGPHMYITPSQIAKGRGDKWLMQLASDLATRGKPAYVRIMAEMNGYWNPYSGFDQWGNLRRGSHPADFRQAWRRIVLIMRGGKVKRLNKALNHLRLPRVRAHGEKLPKAPVAFIWNPQTRGDPDTPANSPFAYWPGSKYVDWVGSDFFSAFSNWQWLASFYSRVERYRKPFAFGEWGIWGSDAPDWASQFFAWCFSHRWVRMLVYYQSYFPHGNFDLGTYTRARTVIRRWLHSGVFVPG